MRVTGSYHPHPQLWNEYNAGLFPVGRTPSSVMAHPFDYLNPASPGLACWGCLSHCSPTQSRPVWLRVQLWRGRMRQVSKYVGRRVYAEPALRRPCDKSSHEGASWRRSLIRSKPPKGPWRHWAKQAEFFHSFLTVLLFTLFLQCACAPLTLKSSAFCPLIPFFFGMSWFHISL